MPYFESIEKLYAKLEAWQLDDKTTKDDVIQSTRNNLAAILQELLVTPYVGTAFAHPSDNLHPNDTSSDITANRIIFESDECIETDASTTTPQQPPPNAKQGKGNKANS